MASRRALKQLSILLLLIVILSDFFEVSPSNDVPKQSGKQSQLLYVGKNLSVSSYRYFTCPETSRTRSKMASLAATAKRLHAGITTFKYGLLAVTITALSAHNTSILLSGDICENPGPNTSASCSPDSIKSLKGLRICHLNIRSIVNKMDELRMFCENHAPHVISINETWLDHTISDGEVHIEGYSLLRRDKVRNKGGVLVYIDKSVEFVEMKELQDGDIESLWVKIKPHKSKAFLFCSFYRPPNAENEKTFLEGFQNMLMSVREEQEEIIIGGDFNFDWKKRNICKPVKRFGNLMSESSLTQVIKENTRITEYSRTQIDLIFTSRPELYVSGVLHVGFSDHSAVFAVRKLHRMKPPPPRSIETRNYKRYDKDAFVQDLNNVPLPLISRSSFDDVDSSWDTFKILFNDVANSHAPTMKVRLRSREIPWVTPDIRQLMIERNVIHKKAIKTNKELYWSEFKRLRNLVTLKLERRNKGITAIISKRMKETRRKLGKA